MYNVSAILIDMCDCVFAIEMEHTLPLDPNNQFALFDKTFEDAKDNILSLQWNYKIVTQCLGKQLQ